MAEYERLNQVISTFGLQPGLILGQKWYQVEELKFVQSSNVKD